MAQPTMLQTKEITVPLPRRRADLDEGNPHKIDRLVAFTKLTLIKDQALGARYVHVYEWPVVKSIRDWYANRPYSSVKRDSERYDRACSLLESWKQSLPLHLSVYDEKSLRSNAHLDLMYHLIWVYLGRSALLSLARVRLQSSHAACEAHVDADPATEQLIAKCMDGATRILEIIALLHNRNRLAKFSSSDLHSCSSAIIILLLGGLVYPSKPDLSPESSTISNGIEALRFLASGNTLAKDALSLVERFQINVRKRTFHSARKVQHGEATPADPAQLAQGSTGQFASPGFMLDCEDVADYKPSDFASLDPALFSDFEPSLLDYAVPDLTLFGFDGFSAVSETENSAWSWYPQESGV